LYSDEGEEMNWQELISFLGILILLGWIFYLISLD